MWSRNSVSNRRTSPTGTRASLPGGPPPRGATARPPRRGRARGGGAPRPDPAPAPDGHAVELAGGAQPQGDHLALDRVGLVLALLEQLDQSLPAVPGGAAGGGAGGGGGE